MQLKEILKEALDREITKEEALYLFREVKDWKDALQLFEIACRVREQEVGKVIKLMGFLASITPCTTDPPCKYCFRWTSPEVFTPKDVLTNEELAVAVQAMEEAGIKRVEIAGGTLWGKEGSKATLRAVEVITSSTKMEVWINNGPSFSATDVARFKELGIKGIACNLETINENTYKDLRPGDDLRVRKEIVEATERAGLDIDNTLMIGLGEFWEQVHPYEEWVDFLFYFKSFKNFKILEIHPFRPLPGSPVENRPAGSFFESAKAMAIGRLIFRNIDISGADEVIGLMAGANMIMHAVSVTRKRRNRPGVAFGNANKKELGDDLLLLNYLPRLSRQLKDLRMELEI